jgi:transcriptional regulator with XRE-family HTH domain
MTLKTYFGKIPPRGAFSRMAEATGLSFNTISRIYRGESASQSAHARVQNAIQSRTKLFQITRKDKGTKRGKIRTHAKE